MQDCFSVFLVFWFSGFFFKLDSLTLRSFYNHSIKVLISNSIRHTARCLLSLCHALVVDEGLCKLDFPVVER